MRKITAVLGLFCLILSFSCKKDGLDPITPAQQTTSTGTTSTDTAAVAGAAGSSVPNGASTGTKTTTGPTTGGSATTKTSTPTGAVSATSGSATVKTTTPTSGGTGTTPTTPPTTTTPPPTTTATPTMMTGVYGDGVHDDTQVLQKYLNVGDVTLTPGKTYNVTGLRVTYNFDLNGSTIHMTRTSGTGVALVTSGATVTNGSVTGIWSSSALGNPNGVQGMAIYADNATISNVTISSFPSYGIVVVGARNNPSITNCTITTNGYMGFYFDAETGNTSGGVFSNNVVDQSMLPAATISESGVAIRGSSNNPAVVTSNWTITGNVFKMPVKPADWSAEGIEVRYMTNSVISNNTFIAGSIGCSVVRSSGITVSANKFSGSDAEALEFADCKLCSTKNNIITSAINIGILLDGTYGSSDITLNGDIVSGTGSDCIEAYKGCQNITITSCTLTAAKSGKAINLMNTNIVKVQNTTFIGNGIASMAVMLDTCPGNFSMTGGSVTNFKSCVITIYSAQSGLVTNNVTMSGVTVSGVPTALAKVVENGASVGSNIVVSL